MSVVTNQPEVLTSVPSTSNGPERTQNHPGPDSQNAAVRTVGSGCSPADIAKVLDEDGCVVIADLAPPQRIDQIRAELDPCLAAPGGGTIDFRGKPPRRTGALIA